jgi:hypothetical protein
MSRRRRGYTLREKFGFTPTPLGPVTWPAPARPRVRAREPARTRPRDAGRVACVPGFGTEEKLVLKVD